MNHIQITDEDSMSAEAAKQMDAAVRRQHDAKQFFQELLDSVETLTGIADEHGARTLADLMYLQNAILSGGFIDHYPGESNVMEIASALPSGEQWSSFIKVEYMQAPVKTDIEFGDIPGETGELWTRVGEAENALIEKLKDLPEGTAVVLAENIWFLTVEDGQRVLCHAQYKDGTVSGELSNRFEFGLMMADVENDDLRNYAALVEQATEGFQTVVVAPPKPLKAEVLSKVIRLQCCCCGSSTQGRQWHNRDHGYGICNQCVGLVSKRESPEEMHRNYGDEGIHYYVSMEYTEIKQAAEQSASKGELCKVVEMADRLFLAEILKMTDDNWREFTNLVAELHTKLSAE